MTLSYETCKKLKEAGFPQECEKKYEKDTWIFGVCYKGWNVYQKGTDRLEGSEGPDCPTLSELIEACGEDFQDLGKGLNGRWSCVSFTAVHSKGDTKEEAVAELYLALKSK